jgi:hypothetical protein
MLINTCSLVYQTKNIWGKVTGIIVVPGIKCRIEYGNRLITDWHGEQVLSVATVFFKKGAAVNNDTLVRIDGRDHAVAQILIEQDSFGAHHKEALIT